MLKCLFFSGRENCRIIFGNQTCDVTVGELKKCEKFETVLFQSEFQRKTTQNEKLVLTSFSRTQNLKENGL